MEEPKQQSPFPVYYRKAGKCIKVVSPTETRTIILPPERIVPERFSTIYPARERLIEELLDYTLTDAITWRSFFFTFAQAVQAEREKANKSTMVE